MKARIYALFFLGWRFFIHVLKMVSPFHKSPGLDHYRRNYEADGLTTISPVERNRMLGFEKCIACDACVHSYFVANHYDARQPTPRDLALCLSRSMPDYPSARKVVDSWKGMDRFEAVCPRGVDLPGIVEMMKHHIDAYDRSIKSAPAMVKKAAAAAAASAPAPIPSRAS